MHILSYLDQKGNREVRVPAHFLIEVRDIQQVILLPLYLHTPQELAYIFRIPFVSYYQMPMQYVQEYGSLSLLLSSTLLFPALFESHPFLDLVMRVRDRC